VGLGLHGRKGKAEARRKFLEVLVVTWRCGGTGLDGSCGYWAARGRGRRRGGSRAHRICAPEVDVVVLAGRRLVGQIERPRSSFRRPRAEDGGREVCAVEEPRPPPPLFSSAMGGRGEAESGRADVGARVGDAARGERADVGARVGDAARGGRQVSAGSGGERAMERGGG
jgi:hypothetical protein